MIPVSLFGIDVDMCEAFYEALPQLVADTVDDESYANALFSIESEASLDHIRVADQWANQAPFAWPEDISNEVEMTLRTVNYPDVSLLEHLLTLDHVDATRVSVWMHFSTNLFPLYSEAACATLTRMGVPTPYNPNDIASYGLYVSRLEGLKLYAPAAGLPEIGLPRSRMLQLGLERYE
ncbi:MAG: hypothetical protein OSA21_03390 [Candidatus Poseidoniaceae archaeon]|nr:hypothetical protein [Candidatus Poseidoniaceae archaeon]MDE0869339.1 hypothetical protein [Candidatus Poseidoniaceae archaeon]